METSVGIDILLLEEMDEGMASIAHTPPKMDRSRTRTEEQRRGLSYRTKTHTKRPIASTWNYAPTFYRDIWSKIYPESFIAK